MTTRAALGVMRWGCRSASVRHVATMPNRTMVARLMHDQATRAEQAGKGRRALEPYARMTAMSPAHGHAWWERARLGPADDDVDAARDSLTAMLEATREPDLSGRVRDSLAAVAASQIAPAPAAGGCCDGGESRSGRSRQPVSTPDPVWS